MKRSPRTVLEIFRTYKVGPNQILFIHNLDAGARSAMAELIDEGLVVRAKHKNSYCLTDSGYAAVRGR